MKSFSTIFTKLAFALSIPFLLNACSSELTGIDAPPSVENGTPFEASATHQFLDFDQSAFPVETPEGAMVFGVFFPEGWSVNPAATYEGSWNGVPQNLPLQLQAMLPDTNFYEVLAASEPPPDEDVLEAALLSDCAETLANLGPEDTELQFAFFQSTNLIWEDVNPQPGDGGEFTFELTPAGVDSDSQITVIHGLLYAGSFSVDEGPEQDVLGCSFFPDTELSNEAGILIPDSVVANFIQLDTASVPVMGGGMVALLSVLLAIMGVLIGRRRTKQTS